MITSVLLCLSVNAVALHAQSANTGTLIGTATDPSGAVVPGAHVEMKDISTGVTRTAISNGAGQYSFPGLPPGSYSVKASGTGFRHGPEGLRQFCRVETIIEDHPLLGWLSPLLGRELTFPYKSRTQRLLRAFMRLFY